VEREGCHRIKEMTYYIARRALAVALRLYDKTPSGKAKIETNSEAAEIGAGYPTGG
jgi:hypothetical protein